jgi:cytochrome c553
MDDENEIGQQSVRHRSAYDIDLRLRVPHCETPKEIAMMPGPMRFGRAAALAFALQLLATPAAAEFVVPNWAFPVDPPAVATSTVPTDDGAMLRVPGSRVEFTRSQVRDLFAAPDWHPDSHPPMPDIVARGRKPQVHACGYCHLPDGQGRPENAPLAGLPAAYIEAQVAAFRSGERRSAWHGPNRPIELMVSTAKSATPTEVNEAARYFSSLRMTRRVQVIESVSVPRTHVAGWLYVLMEGAAREPLGQRIIEVAVDHERHELRDAKSAYVAYVPPGSIARGQDIAADGGGVTLACDSCHGADLRGAGLVPPIAGRSPTYILRQLLAFRTGARASAAGAAMQPVVARLDVDDMIAIASYVGSLEP